MEITHAFHPLKGQHFRILQRRRYGGRLVLVLEGTPAGTFAIPEAWTSACPDASDGGARLSPDVVYELRELLADLESRGSRGVDGGGA